MRALLDINVFPTDAVRGARDDHLVVLSSDPVAAE